MLTACALFGFSQSTSVAMLCVFTIPYGLGAGAIDAALNNYVALHYNSRQMSWPHRTTAEEETSRIALKLSDAVKIKGVVLILISFFAYCAFESTCGLWASSYLAEHKGVDVQTAANFASLFYLGITG